MTSFIPDFFIIIILLLDRQKKMLFIHAEEY